MIDLLGVPISLLPVSAFLVVLIFMDSYKLVRLRTILRTLLVGSVVAIVCLYVNSWLLESLRLDPVRFRKYVAPVTEEILKSACVFYLIRASKVGFMVDAAIVGFAVGTGFSLVENIHYLRRFGDAGVLLWIVRGFGTAVIHGSTTAIFGILSKGLTERHGSHSIRFFIPGVLAAITIHSLFNHFILPPLAATAIVLMIMPLVVIVLFDQSEKATRSWLGTGLDADLELLELMRTGEIRQNRIGMYLLSLKSRFPGTVVADMLCLLRIHLELSMQAKALLIARQAGLDLPVGEEVEANLEELRYLEKAIGRTGMLAIHPFLKTNSRDLWQLYMLEKRR